MAGTHRLLYIKAIIHVAKLQNTKFILNHKYNYQNVEILIFPIEIAFVYVLLNGP